MTKRLILAICIPLGIQACAIGNPAYPTQWDPLVQSVAADCRAFEGSYADRGRTRDGLTSRSLTRELFGYREEWRRATRVQFQFQSDNVLQVTIWAGDEKASIRNLHAETGDFACEQGKLVIRDKRWVAEDLVAGHEKVTIEMHVQGTELIAFVREFTFAMAFLVVPFVADAAHWYRFERTSNQTVIR